MHQLAEALWPDADGDRAMQAFESALHRLRRALGDTQSVLLRDGHLSLNPDRVWVDAAAFEAFVRRHETVEQGLALYQGRFLEGTDAPWVLLRREALHQTFLDRLDHVAQRHAGVRRWEQAIAWYQRGLEIDPLAEVCYRRLMAVYLHLGRRAEGLMIYRRCKMMLEMHMDVSPSRETEMLARQLRATLRDSPPNR
jgi:DNA-binding SARP family transcriptional activator